MRFPVLRNAGHCPTIEGMVKGLERRDSKITIRLPQSLRDALEREAARERRTVSDVMILLLTDAMAKRSPKGR